MSEQFSEEWVNETRERHVALIARAESIADEIASLRGLNLRFLSGPRVTFEWPSWRSEQQVEVVEATWEDDRGNNDSKYVTFPVSYLWQTDVLDQEKARLRAEAKEKERKAVEAKTQQEATLLANRRATYERLKREFESGAPGPAGETAR